MTDIPIIWVNDRPGFHSVKYRSIRGLELRVADQISARAVYMKIINWKDSSRLRDAIMDTHCRSVPLDLEGVLRSKHDVFSEFVCGMVDHFNPIEKRLKAKWCPPFALETPPTYKESNT